MTDFNNNFTKRCYWDWQQSDTSADLEHEGQGHILQSNINYCQTIICAGSHFFTLDNCLLHMDTPHIPASYLRFTALVNV